MFGLSWKQFLMVFLTAFCFQMGEKNKHVNIIISR